jgi:hypothetical protein
MCIILARPTDVVLLLLPSATSHCDLFYGLGFESNYQTRNVLISTKALLVHGYIKLVLAVRFCSDSLKQNALFIIVCRIDLCDYSNIIRFYARDSQAFSQY